MSIRNTATAVGFGGRPDRPTDAKLKRWQPHEAGKQKAFFSLELPSGLILHDLRLMTSDDGFWIARPSRKLLSADGQPQLDLRGKPKYLPIVDFASRQAADRFCTVALEAIRREHPEIFKNEAH